MSDLKRKYEDISKSDDEPQESLKKIVKSDKKDENFDVFLLFEKEKSMFHLVKNINQAQTNFKRIDFSDYSDEFIVENKKQKDSEIVLFLVNTKDIRKRQFFNLNSNIDVLNGLKLGDTIQWPLEYGNFAYHRAIISELNINPKIIHLNQSNGMASSASSSTSQGISSSELNGSITEENLLKYIYAKNFFKFLYQHKKYKNLTKRKPDDIAKKARESIGLASYSFCFDNCQEFCADCTFSNYKKGLSDGVIDGIESAVNLVTTIFK